MVDLVCHARGWMTGAYLDQVRRTDEMVGRFLAAAPPQVTIIVTSDHGGAGYTHWAGTPEDVHIPWLVRGPGVHPARFLNSPVHTFDTAATAAYILGVTLDPRSSGKAITEPWN